TVRAPATPGDYPQFFNLVEEGVTWFSQQGGPPDNQLQVRVTVVPPPPCPSGQSETWVCEGDERVRCVAGVTEREACALGCVDASGGAVCATAPADDGDGDGVGAATDCDDADPTIHPGAWDFCEDGIDQDCDGRDRLCSELVDGSAPGDDGGVVRRDAGPGGDPGDPPGTV